MSTPANVILIAEGKTHLFSFGKDGHPKNAATILSQSQRILDPLPDWITLGWAETQIRIDACYGYVIDLTTNKIRAFRPKRFDWQIERTTAELLAFCFANEVDLRNRQEGPIPPVDWTYQPADQLNEPLPILPEIAAEWDALFDTVDLLFAQWPNLPRAEQQARLAAIAPTTGLMFDGGIDPLKQNGFTPITIVPAGIQGYYQLKSDHLKGNDWVKLIPFDELTDQQLHDCYVHWYRAEG